MIVGFSLNQVNAEKFGGRGGNTKVNFKHSVENVEQADIPAFDEACARVSFNFTVAYRQQEEDVATIDFDGTLLWQQDADAVIEQWEDEEALDSDVATAVANHIFRKCLTQAVGLADSLELPSPVPMPRINQNQ